MNKISNEFAGTVGVSEAADQLRYFTCKCNHEDLYRIGFLPYIRSSRLASEWIRRNGHTFLTNQSFRGLLSDITRRVISDEEADTVRLLSGVVANISDTQTVAVFATEEERSYVEDLLKSGQIDDVRVTITQTVLGAYIEVGPEHTYEVDLD